MKRSVAVLPLVALLLWPISCKKQPEHRGRFLWLTETLDRLEEECRYESNERSCRMVLILRPDSIAGLLGLAGFRVQLGRRIQAEAAWRQVLALKPNHAGALELLGMSMLSRAVRDGRNRADLQLVNRAEPLLTRAVSQNDGILSRDSLASLYAWQYRLGHKNPKAIPFLLESIKKYPKGKHWQGKWHMHLGELYEIEGRTAEAEQAFCLALKQYQTFAAKACLRLRARLSNIASVEAYNPGKDWLGHLALAIHYLFKSGHAQQALDHLNQATALNPGHKVAWNELAKLHHLLGNKQKACAALHKKHKIAYREAKKEGPGPAASERGAYEYLIKDWGCDRPQQP